MPGGGIGWDPPGPSRLIAATDFELLAAHAPQRSIDARLAEPCPLDDDRHSLSSLAQVSNLFHPVLGELALAPKLHAAILRLGNSIHLTLSPDVILELNQSEDAHHQLASSGRGVDRRVVQHLEANDLLSELGNDAIEIRGDRSWGRETPKRAGAQD
jgi:hypothetical protein